MRNDRGKRGGKAGAKNGRADGRGRGLSQPQGEANGGRGDSANRGEGGVGAWGTGGGRGGTGQPRRGGRGSSGKRLTGSADAAAGGASAVAKNRRRVGARASKKAKTGEASVLWSPGKGKGGDGDVSSSLGAGIGGSGRTGSNGDAQNLLTLAENFRERYGEDLASDDDSDEVMKDIDAFETPGCKSSFSGSPTHMTPVEQVAWSMSPARLAAEAQKARARAREERFGGGGGSSTSRPSFSAPPARSLSTGKPAGVPRDAPPAAAASKVPLDRTASAQLENTGKNGKEAIFVTATPPVLQQHPDGTGNVPPPSPKGLTLTKGLAGSSVGATPRLVSPMATANEASVAASFTSAAAAAPVLVRLDTETCDASPPSKTAIAANTVVTAEAIPMDETPRVTSVGARKRPAPEGGNVVVIEPPAKKVLAPPKTPPTQPSLPASEATGGKVHTLRLRLRTDLAVDAKHPGQTVTAATAGGRGSGDDGGVEECKGFEPPNPPPDAGVEECKGFDPPNLPKKAADTTATDSKASAVSVQSTGLKTPSVASSGTPATESAATSALATATPAATTPTASVSRVSAPVEGGTPVVPAFTPERPWGPSFGISGAAARTAGNALVPATAALPRDVNASRKTNPWILSPESPTFAKNQGRPLAQAFPNPARPAWSSSSGSSTSSAMGERGRGSAARAAHGNQEVVAPVQPPVLSSRSSGGGSSGGGVIEGRGGGTGGSGIPGTLRPPSDSIPHCASPPSPAAGGARGGDLTGVALLTQALSPVGVSAGSNAQPPTARRPEVLHPVSAAAAADGGGSVAGATVEAAAGSVAATSAQAATGASSGQLVLGVRLRGRAAELLERMKREREESLDLERKLTHALLEL